MLVCVCATVLAAALAKPLNLIAILKWPTTQCAVLACHCNGVHVRVHDNPFSI